MKLLIKEVTTCCAIFVLSHAAALAQHDHHNHAGHAAQPSAGSESASNTSTATSARPLSQAEQFESHCKAKRMTADHSAMDHGSHSTNGMHHDPTKWSMLRPDSHAPIGVMGDHTHHKGMWMFSYRFMYMAMDDNYDGSDVVADRSFLAANLGGVDDGTFLVAPTFMDMEMHMLGLMYAPTNELTVSVMLPIISKSMDHLRQFQEFEFKTTSGDVGDIKLGALYKIYDANRQRIHLNFAVSLPTGSITEEDGTPPLPAPAGGIPALFQLNNARLPYTMQIGSGTVDFEPGITYLGQSDHFSWGAQAKGLIRAGENDEGYTLGNQFNGTAWGALKLNNWLSTSVRVSGKVWGDIEGEDVVLAAARGVNPPNLQPSDVVPTARPDLRGGAQMDIALGLNLYIPEGWMKGQRFAIEGGLPFWRDLDGPQLGEEFQITGGWKIAW